MCKALKALKALNTHPRRRVYTFPAALDRRRFHRSWEHASQAKQIIPTAQLYPNVSTVGDMLWLDTGGDGRQDFDEVGVGG